MFEIKTNEQKKNALKEKKTISKYIFKPNIFNIDIHHKFGNKNHTTLTKLNFEVSITGRILQIRNMGKATFVTLQDSTEKIQIYISEKNISYQNYIKIVKKFNLGDILGITGKIFKTKTNELSIRCTEVQLLTKAFRPLPGKFHGLCNLETRYRKRYLDLIINPKIKKIFYARSKILNFIRCFMTKKNFLEVETPMMHSIPGGANARPFITYNNSLNTSMYLRIAPELYLKRLVIGGLERIFEINRSFRNEGISLKHNPEFTMMEVYMAYADYQDMIKLTETLLKEIANHIFNCTEIKYGNYKFNFSEPFEQYSMITAILKFNPNIKQSDLSNIKQAKKLLNTLGIEINESWKLGKLITEIFNKTTEKKLINPVFITEYPVEVSPLAQRNQKNPEISDRFELFIAGYEIANGFSELNDPKDQKTRFKKQIKDHNPKKYPLFYDKEYITALEYGLPPTAGLGIGIDRLIMIYTNQKNIRDTILFPTLRPVHNKS